MVGERVGVVVRLGLLWRQPSLCTFIHLTLLARTFVPLPYRALFVLKCVDILLAHLVPLGLWYVFFLWRWCAFRACGSLLSFACGCPLYHAPLRIDGLESIRGLM